VPGGDAAEHFGSAVFKVACIGGVTRGGFEAGGGLVHAVGEDGELEGFGEDLAGAFVIPPPSLGGCEHGVGDDAGGRRVDQGAGDPRLRRVQRFGLYVLVEAVNSDCLTQHFKNGRGSLYEGYMQDINQELDQDGGADNGQQDLNKLLRICRIEDL